MSLTLDWMVKELEFYKFICFSLYKCDLKDKDNSKWEIKLNIQVDIYVFRVMELYK